MAVTFTFNAKTGHVKRDGAVIGRVELDRDCWVWVPASFRAPGRVMRHADRDQLLGRVKDDLTRPRGGSSAPPKART